jgi:hypothetical protein
MGENLGEGAGSITVGEAVGAAPGAHVPATISLRGQVDSRTPPDHGLKGDQHAAFFLSRMWMWFVMVVVGLCSLIYVICAVVWAAEPAASILELLKWIAATIFPVLTALLGYLFGRRESDAPDDAQAP